MMQAADFSEIGSRRSLLTVVAMLAVLAASMVLFFNFGTQPAEADNGSQTTEAAKNAIIQRSPSSIDYGSVKVGASKDATVTVTGVDWGCSITFLGTCVSPLFGGGIATTGPTISGPNAGNFSIVGDGCTNNTLDQGESCNIIVRFSPNNAQNFNATLTIPPHENGATSFSGDNTVALSGEGFVEVPPNEPPKVISWTPTGQKVGPGANATAAFSEAMLASSINAGTFTLTRRGASNPVGALVTYDPGAKKATLNPNRNLRRGATYVARVTTGAKDSLGLSLDQDPVTPGSQPKTWRFTVRP